MMAAKRTKAVPSAIASGPWVSDERSAAVGFIEQEVDEFTFAVRNEMDWLNEHMLEVFDENRSWNLAELMKTPGKLRGKTPRTARKRDPLEVRAPLTEVFGPNERVIPSPSRETNQARQKIQFKVAEDPEPKKPLDARKESQMTSSQSTKHTYTQSSFETEETYPTSVSPEPEPKPRSPTRGRIPHPSSPQRKAATNTTRSPAWIPSMKEAHDTTTTPLGTPAFLKRSQAHAEASTAMDVDPVISYPQIDALREAQDDDLFDQPVKRQLAGESRQALAASAGTHKDTVMLDIHAEFRSRDIAQKGDDEMADHDSPAHDEMEDVRSNSEGSSPVHPVVRKSSLNLASLPAREPLTTKKSIGKRTSQMTHIEGGDSKTTTQRLHDRINMLKQSHHSKAAPPPPPATSQTADGPISASKAKLSSILKSARGMMVRSAGASAQAKMETYSAPQTMSPTRSGHESRVSMDFEEDDHPPVMVPSDEEDKRKMEMELEAAAKEVQRAEEQQAERERQKVAAAAQAQAQQAPAASQKAKEIRRPTKRPDPKNAAANKPKPVPVSIRVGTASQLTASHRDADQRKNGPTNPPPNTALAATLGQSLAPANPAPARPGLQKKPSNPSFSSSTSTSTMKSSATGKPKALLAAARRKEMEEKEAQKKLVQKREMEREMEKKRVAQQEEDRRRDREEADRQREQNRAAAQDDPKKAAQRKAIEKRRLELAKKMEQQKKPLPAVPRPSASTKTSNAFNHGHADQHENRPQTQQQAHRGDLGNGRPVSKLHAGSNIRAVPQDDALRAITQPQLNPARPPKRFYDSTTDGETHQPARPQRGSNLLSTHPDHNAKRRKTSYSDADDDDDILAEDATPGHHQPHRSMMPPPVRQPSLLHNKAAAKPSIFSHSQQSQQSHAQPPTYATSTIRPSGHPQPQSSLRPPLPVSSPAAHHGSDISLPEIDTDSSSTESSPAVGGSAPTWADQARLNQILVSQQLVDPEEIFGPIAPLKMEEIFRDKERHHRFRGRTSSANWSGEDRLTREECENDRRERERVAREGGWRFKPSGSAEGSGSKE